MTTPKLKMNKHYSIYERVVPLLNTFLFPLKFNCLSQFFKNGSWYTRAVYSLGFQKSFLFLLNGLCDLGVILKDLEQNSNYREVLKRRKNPKYS